MDLFLKNRRILHVHGVKRRKFFGGKRSPVIITNGTLLEVNAAFFWHISDFGLSVSTASLVAAATDANHVVVYHQNEFDIMSYLAESYERFMVPSLFAPWATYLVRRADPQPGEHVLDIACGTGIVARNVAPRVGRSGSVVGLDINPDMVDMARTAAEQDHLTIEWHTSPAEQIPFPDEHFDLILCQFGLMFFTDRHAALKEMVRVLRKDGRAVLSVWQGLDQHPFYQTLHEVSQRRFGKSSVEAVFSLGNSSELRKLLTGSGFPQVEVEPMSITAHFPQPEEFLAWEIDIDPAEALALRNLDREAQQAIMTAARQDMQHLLEEIMQENEVVLAFHAHIAQARK